MIDNYPCRKLFIILTVSMAVFACSQSPLSSIKQSAGEVALIDRVKVKRQREFVIPPLSHVGLLFMPVRIDSHSDSQNNSLFVAVSNEGSYTFGHVFSSATVLERVDGQTQGKIDFIIKATLIDAVFYPYDTHADEKKTGNGENEGQLISLNKPVKFATIRRLTRPYHALIKVELLDARSKKPLDVAIIKSRSGALGSKQFAGLLRQSFSAYSKAITAHYASVY